MASTAPGLRFLKEAKEINPDDFSTLKRKVIFSFV
jgi:hypothetical protein